MDQWIRIQAGPKNLGLDANLDTDWTRIQQQLGSGSNSAQKLDPDPDSVSETLVLHY